MKEVKFRAKGVYLGLDSDLIDNVKNNGDSFDVSVGEAELEYSDDDYRKGVSISIQHCSSENDAWITAEFSKKDAIYFANSLLALANSIDE